MGYQVSVYLFSSLQAKIVKFLTNKYHRGGKRNFLRNLQRNTMFLIHFKRRRLNKMPLLHHPLLEVQVKLHKFQHQAVLHLTTRQF